MSDQDRDNSRASRRGRDDGDGHGGGAGRAPGKTTRSAQGAEAAQAPEAQAADPVADFEAALAAGDPEAAIAAWDKVPSAKQKKMEKATLLSAIRLIGPRSARIMKESGAKPSTDIRIAQEILHNHPTTEWIEELDKAKLVGNFLKAKPVRHQLDQAGLERLADFAGPKAPTNKLAEAAYEKAWGPTKTGKLDDGGWTVLGENWNRENCARMYQALLSGSIPPAHLHGLKGIYIAHHYIDNATKKKEKVPWGYFWESYIVMPLGTSGTTHIMVGGADSPADEKMEHFQTTALHEVGHLVGDETGEHEWGAKSGSPLHMESIDAAEAIKELWDNGKSDKHEGKGEPATAADAKLYLEAKVRGEGGAAYASTTWAQAGRSRKQFEKNLEEQYGDQPLYKMAEDVENDPMEAYRHAQRGTHSRSKMLTYLTRTGGYWTKYNKEAYDNRVSLYSVSSPKEWFAEQYQYYMTHDGETPLPEVNAKFKKIMAELDERAPGKKKPGISGPGAGSGRSGKDKEKDKEESGGGEGGGGEGGARQGGARSRERTDVHRFEMKW